MGKVVTKALLSNDEDRVIKNGQLTEEHLRQLECELIVDTGARAVGLPLSIIEQLGLPPTAQGDRDTLRWESTGASTVWRIACPGGGSG